MISTFFDFLDNWRIKRGVGIFRPWHQEQIFIHQTYFFSNQDSIYYREQIKDSVVDIMMDFVQYENRDFVDEVFTSSETKIYKFFHKRRDEKDRLFEGVIIALCKEVEKNHYDRIDLIFEDIAVKNRFDGEVNQVRLYISPAKNFAKNDYELLYWDASDKKSLYLFQEAYQNEIALFKRDYKKKYTNLYFKLLNRFKKNYLNEYFSRLKNSFFINVN
jgi:hypothetical protein